MGLTLVRTGYWVVALQAGVPVAGVMARENTVCLSWSGAPGAGLACYRATAHHAHAQGYNLLHADKYVSDKAYDKFWGLDLPDLRTVCAEVKTTAPGPALPVVPRHRALDKHLFSCYDAKYNGHPLPHLPEELHDLLRTCEQTGIDRARTGGPGWDAAGGTG